MSAPDPLAEYRTAFFLTFAEDHGLVNEWQMETPSPITNPSDVLPIKVGTTLIGFLNGGGLPS